MYSQNSEDELIADYFGGQVGRLLDIGANDGVTLSNSRLLVELGWEADFVEPSPSAFGKLSELYRDSDQARLHNFAIGTKTGQVDFFDSDWHLKQGDTALISSMSVEHVEKWKRHTKPDKTRQGFTKMRVPCFAYSDTPFVDQPFDFITIDAEGMDFEILKQINLSRTDALCIECTGGKERQVIEHYARGFGLLLAHSNFENLIFFR